MKKLVCLIVFVFFKVDCLAQNLVPNGDFEQYTMCPTAGSQIDYCFPWMNPNGLSPEYFNACNTGTSLGVPVNYPGYQQSHSGNGYAGIGIYIQQYPNFRECIEVPLTSPLIQGQSYLFQMYVSVADDSRFSTDDFGVYFSDSLIYTSSGSLSPLTPQVTNATGNFPDTLNWTLMSGTYNAIGGEQYIVIGNFVNDSTITLLQITNGTDYMVYLYIDDVSLTPVTGIDEIKSELNLFPNPLANELNIETNSNKLYEITLYDIYLKKHLQQSFKNSASINIEHISSGIYFYELRNKNNVVKKGKIVKQ